MTKPTDKPERASTLADRWNDPIGMTCEGKAPRVLPLAGRFFIVGARPVRTVAMPGGGMDVEALDWKTGRFVRAMEYLSRVSFPDGEVDEVDEGAFAAAVSELTPRGG